MTEVSSSANQPSAGEQVHLLLVEKLNVIWKSLAEPTANQAADELLAALKQVSYEPKK